MTDSIKEEQRAARPQRNRCRAYRGSLESRTSIWRREGRVQLREKTITGDRRNLQKCAKWIEVGYCYSTL